MHPRLLVVTSIVAVVASALFAAGCGGGASPHVARIVTSTTAATAAGQQGPVAFTHCMRSNGVARFPDPPPIGSHGPKPNLAQLGVSAAQFRSAVGACQHLLPNGGSEPQQNAQQARTQLADMLSFARCMRSHGVRRFPDPSATAGLTTAMVEAQGIDVHSPAVLHVVQVCLPASHGLLTAAKIRQAIATKNKR